MIVPLLALAAPAYRIVDLGLPPGAEEVRATAINNRGEVLVATSIRDTGRKDAQGVPIWANGHAFLWRMGRFFDFGDPKPSALQDPMRAEPGALNDLSVAVGNQGTGSAVFMSGLQDVTAFIWRGKGMEELGQGWSAIPTAINDLGDVVGSSNHRGFARLRGKLWGLDTLSHVPARNDSSAVAINAHRLILGTSTYGGTPGKADYTLPSRPFTIDGNRLPLRMVPVPLPKGYRKGSGIALNDAGTILARASRDRGKEGLAYLVRDGWIVPLPFAGAMNGRNEVVGGLPFEVWRNGRITPLPAFLGWALQTATGINDRGTICGTGLHGGKVRAYVLLPN